MADAFRTFFGVQPLCYVNNNFRTLLPSKRLSSLFLYSYGSRTRRRNKWPIHNNLVSETSQTSSSTEFDVISTHEHSDGSLIFRFGDPSELSKNFQMDQSEAEEEVIQRERDGEDSVPNVFDIDRGRATNDSSFDEQSEVDEGEIQEEEEEGNLVKALDSYRGRDTEESNLEEKSEEEDEEIHKESEGEDNGAKGNLNIESKVEEEEIQKENEGEYNVVKVFDGDHGTEPNESSLDGESTSTVTGRQAIGLIEKEANLSDRLMRDSDEYELSNRFSNVETNDSSIQDSEIVDTKIGEDGMQEESEHSTPTGEPVLDVNSNLETSIDARESSQNSTTDDAKLESSSPNPDPAITVFENDVSLAKQETSVVAVKQNDIVELKNPSVLEISELTPIEQSVITEKGTDINVIEDSAPQTEVDSQFSTEANNQTFALRPGLIDDIVEDGRGGDAAPLVFMSAKLEDKATIDEGNGAIEDYRDHDSAESLYMPDATHVTEVEPSESATESQEVPFADLFLSSGAAMLPHPSRVLSGGEDAYFTSGETWLGVADGVSLWSFEGTSPGVYGKELINNCQKLISDCKVNLINHPLELLSLSVTETKSPGSSTVLIAQLVGQVLHIANIGDSGFIIIRDGSVYRRSSPMLHAFYFPLQIQKGDDPPILAEIEQIDIQEDDVIVIATDGLLDNLYEHDVVSKVLESLKVDIELQEIACILATKAQEVGGSSLTRSPFADDAQAAGYVGYAGGNLDDVTVIVSVVQRR